MLFDVSLDDIMKLQKRQDLPPIILLYFTDAILKLKGCSEEGLFRYATSRIVVVSFLLPHSFSLALGRCVLCIIQCHRISGNHEEVKELKATLTTGQFTVSMDTDPHVVASAFKAWLRSLTEPIIPRNL